MMRELPPTSAFSDDVGDADPAVTAALMEWGDGTAGLDQVVGAMAGTRVLVPIVAEENRTGPDAELPSRHSERRSASAGIVAVGTADSRTALPVFSSQMTMSAWRAQARPVPTDIAQAAAAAVDEGWDLLVVDPAGPVTALLPRPAVRALASRQLWQPAVTGTGDDRRVDSAVTAAVRDAVQRVLAGMTVDSDEAPSPRRWFGRRQRHQNQTMASDSDPGHATGPIVAVEALPGHQAELAVALTLVPGLDRVAVNALTQQVAAALARDELVTERVDSVELRLN